MTPKTVPEAKLKAVQEMKDLFRNKKTVLLASVKGLPGSQFQEIGKKVKKKSVLKVPKKSLLLRAIDESKNEALGELKNRIEDSYVVIFSDEDSFDLGAELLKSKSAAKAKPGQEAPEDISVSAGPTDLTPGPAISELGALGIQIQIEKGKINIKEDKVIVKAGQKISQGAADVMSKLDIKPFSIGYTPLAAVDLANGKYYSEIKIDAEEALANLKRAFSRALPFAIERGYFSGDTIKYHLAKAHAHGSKVNRIMTGEPCSGTESQASSPEGERESEVAPVEEKVEEKKEEKEESAPAAEGLGALFG